MSSVVGIEDESWAAVSLTQEASYFHEGDPELHSHHKIWTLGTPWL